MGGLRHKDGVTPIRICSVSEDPAASSEVLRVLQQLVAAFLLGVAACAAAPEGLRGLLTASSAHTMMLIVRSSSPLTHAECAAARSYLWLLNSPKAPWKCRIVRCISAEGDEMGGGGGMLQDICDTDRCDI